jgi:uncharacterized protein (TIGR04255 family)
VDKFNKLNNQPLKFALAEFRFSPVMQIAEFIPRIQEALRKQYPTPVKRSGQTVQVQPSGISVSAEDRWAFISSNKKSAIEINQERITYVTTEYPRFPEFSEICKQAIKTLVDIVEPSLVLRIGLRYSDLITVDHGEDITNLVDKHFGLPSSIESLGGILQYSTDTFIHTDMGGLAIRTLYGENDLACLPDIKGLPIPIKADTKPSERMIIDFDHYWEAKEESVNFETSEVLKKLSSLHKTTRDAFWKVTTDYARNRKWA